MSQNPFPVKLESSSKISKKLTVTIPANILASKFDKQLAQIQKKAKLKGFRQGHVPMPMVLKYYGSEARQQVCQNTIDEAYREAIKEHQIRVIGQPSIDLKKGTEGFLKGDAQDLIFEATIEVFPEIEPKNYTGIFLKKEKTEVTVKDVEEVVTNIQNQHAQLSPVTEDRLIKKGDYVDFEFNGGLVTESGVEEYPGMKGQRMMEIGSGGLIEGFEDQMIGCKKGESKIFNITFPSEYSDKKLENKEAQFTIKINELKQKDLPELNDDFAKEAGYESVADLKEKAKEALTRTKTETAENKIRSDLMQAILEKNKFEVPQALIEAQTRALAQEYASDLKQNQYPEKLIQQLIGKEIEKLKERAELQVKTGLILDAISKKEGIKTDDKDYDKEIQKMSDSMKLEVEKIKEFYDQNPSRKEGFMFKLLEEKTIDFLLSKATIK